MTKEEFYNAIEISEEDKARADKCITSKGLTKHVLIMKKLEKWTSDRIKYTEIASTYRYDKRVRFMLFKPYDPQTKGRVEQAVRFVKEHFLGGREYCGIDCLNSSCLEWLDKSGNAVIKALAGKTAHELFREEAKSLIKIPYKLNEESVLHSVNKTNSLRYKKNNYELPIGFKPGEKVEVKEVDGKLLILIPESGEIICEHGIPNGFGNTVKLKDTEHIESVGYAVRQNAFPATKTY